jgi:hypothetical protein
VVVDKLELLAEAKLERFRRIAASNAGAMWHPTEQWPRRLDELPPEVLTAIEEYELNPDGTIATRE